MDYIINPAWFYWLSVSDGLKTFSIAFAILSFVILIVLIVYYFVEIDSGTAERYLTIYKRWILLTAVFSIAFMLISVFVPNKQTMIEMQVASIATKTNAEWTIEQLKGITDYIIERIQSVKQTAL